MSCAICPVKATCIDRFDNMRPVPYVPRYGCISCAHYYVSCVLCPALCVSCCAPCVVWPALWFSCCAPPPIMCPALCTLRCAPPIVRHVSWISCCATCVPYCTSYTPRCCAICPLLCFLHCTSCIQHCVSCDVCLLQITMLLFCVVYIYCWSFCLLRPYYTYSPIQLLFQPGCRSSCSFIITVNSLCLNYNICMWQCVVQVNIFLFL